MRYEAFFSWFERLLTVFLFLFPPLSLCVSLSLDCRNDQCFFFRLCFSASSSEGGRDWVEFPVDVGFIAPILWFLSRAFSSLLRCGSVDSVGREGFLST